MDVISEPEALLRIVLAACFGAIIGLDREARHKPAGLRTYSIVAMGSAFFSLVGLIAFGENDAAARIAAQIVTGVGFLGAGTVLHYRGNVVGLTTAAGIWGAAAIGMGFGFGLYVLSIGGSIVMLVILRVFGEVVGGARHPDEIADDASDEGED